MWTLFLLGAAQWAFGKGGRHLRLKKILFCFSRKYLEVTFTWFIIWGCIFSTRYFREKIANQNLACDTLNLSCVEWTNKSCCGFIKWINHEWLEALWRSWELYPALRNALSGSRDGKGEFKSNLGDRKERVDSEAQTGGKWGGQVSRLLQPIDCGGWGRGRLPDLQRRS